MLRERKKQEKREEKARRKAERKEAKRLRAEAIERGEDPDAVAPPLDGSEALEPLDGPLEQQHD